MEKVDEVTSDADPMKIAKTPTIIEIICIFATKATPRNPLTAVYRIPENPRNIAKLLLGMPVIGLKTSDVTFISTPIDPKYKRNVITEEIIANLACCASFLPKDAAMYWCKVVPVRKNGIRRSICRENQYRPMNHAITERKATPKPKKYINDAEKTIELANPTFVATKVPTKNREGIFLSKKKNSASVLLLPAYGILYRA
jgi:hypothetical protein